MLLKDGISLALADLRYLRKDAAATDQTIAGTGTITSSSYAWVFTAGNVTMSSGLLSVANATASVTATLSNTSGPGGGVAASIQRTNAGTALQVGNNVTLTNFIVTAAGAFTATGLATLNAGLAASAATSTITQSAGIALNVWRTTSAGNAFQVLATDGSTVKASITDLGTAVFGASATSNSTVTVHAAANTGINVPLSGSTSH